MPGSKKHLLLILGYLLQHRTPSAKWSNVHITQFSLEMEGLPPPLRLMIAQHAHLMFVQLLHRYVLQTPSRRPLLCDGPHCNNCKESHRHTQCSPDENNLLILIPMTCAVCERPGKGCEWATPVCTGCAVWQRAAAEVRYLWKFIKKTQAQ
jgi:hypothetical protein